MGLTGKISKSKVKQAYFDLIAQYHPDKVQHLGKELQDLANRKSKEIIEAYNYFKKEYVYK
ncbi:MAG: DnaJ domain-containing protein [Bacteroidota bacterium]